MSDTYIKQFCPHCESKNWVCLGDQQDVTSTIGDATAIKCWKCGKKFWRDDFVNFSENEYEDMVPGWDPSKSTEENLEEVDFKNGEETP